METISRTDQILLDTIYDEITGITPQSNVEKLLVVLNKKIAQGGGGTGGTTNYNNLDNLPKINGVTLQGNVSGVDLSLQNKVYKIFLPDSVTDINAYFRFAYISASKWATKFRLSGEGTELELMFCRIEDESCIVKSNAVPFQNGEVSSARIVYNSDTDRDSYIDFLISDVFGSNKELQIEVEWLYFFPDDEITDQSYTFYENAEHTPIINPTVSLSQTVKEIDLTLKTEFSGNLSGNADTASKLQHEVKIGNADFDGSKDITLEEAGIDDSYAVMKTTSGDCLHLTDSVAGGMLVHDATRNLFNGKYETFSLTSESVILNEYTGRCAVLNIENNKKYSIFKSTASNRGSVAFSNSLEYGTVTSVKTGLVENKLIIRNTDYKYLLVYVSNESEEPDLLVEEIPEGASEDDYPHSYVPYEYEITSCGKNIFGGEALADKIVDYGGTKDSLNKTVSYNNHTNGLLFNNFKENTQYTVILKGTSTTPLHATNVVVRYLTDIPDEYIKFSTSNVERVTFVSKENATVKSISLFYADIGDNILYYEECGIFEGVLTEDDFEPYQSSTVTINPSTEFPLLLNSYDRETNLLPSYAEVSYPTKRATTDIIKVTDLRTKDEINALDIRSHMTPRFIDWNNNIIGKDITDYYNGLVTCNGKTYQQAVADGSFDGIYVGDYVIQTVTIDETAVQNIKYVADLNTWKSDANDYARISQNSVTFLNVLNTTHRMNESHTTEGGYAGSELARWLDSSVLPALQTATGSTSRFLSHLKLLSSAVGTSLYNRSGSATGASSERNWYIKSISLPTESQLGYSVWSSSGFDTGEAYKKLSIFDAVNPNFIFKGKYIWLRDVASASYFCCLSDGCATHNGAGYTFSVAPLTIEI